MNILTFDIEEWFHILDHDSTRTEREWGRYERRLDQNVERILALLDDHGLTATFFCLGWVAREYPHIVRSIASRGHELACHSDLHQLVYEQNRSVFAIDLKQALGSIEDVTGTKITAYRAPGFSVNAETRWFFEELAGNGIEVDCSVFPAARAHGGFADYGHGVPSWLEVDGVRLKEFPINVLPVFGQPLIFSGGGYFRLLPYWLLRRFMSRSDYVMTYFHPRDFDVAQPIVEDLGAFRRFKSYYGLGAAYDKLVSLTRDFHFVDLQTAVSSVDWASAPVRRV